MGCHSLYGFWARVENFLNDECCVTHTASLRATLDEVDLELPNRTLM